MDNRLDFFNTLNEYVETLDEKDDALILLSYNKTQGDSICLIGGDWNVLSELISSIDVEGLVNGDKEPLIEMRKCIVNMCYNICNQNEEIREKLIKGLKSL